MGIKALFNKANPTYFSGIDKVNVIIAYILVAIFPHFFVFEIDVDVFSFLRCEICTQISLDVTFFGYK